MSRATAPATLPWTEDDEANRLLASDANALLIGFALDQQVTVQKAFAGPLVLKQRLGHLDVGRIAAMPPDELEAVFREKPAIHRFPGSMAGRVQALCGVIADRYGGDGSRVWSEAATAADLVARLRELPGHPTLGDVDSAEALAGYQEAKRAHKAKVRADKSRTG